MEKLSAYATLVPKNIPQEEDYYDGEGGDSTFDYSCTFPLPPSGEGNIDADPLLVDPIHGDVRLRSASPCIDAASSDIDHCDLDIYGHPRVQGEAPEMGAVEGNFEDRICVSASVRGIGTVTPQSAFVEAGGSVTFTASSDVREFLAFEIDGIKLTFSEETFEYIVDKAVEFKLGARGLRSICEIIMNDAMFEMPSEKVKEFTVTLDYAKSKLDKANLHKLQLQ